MAGLVKNSTFKKKMEASRAALVAKNDAIQAEADKKKNANNAMIAFYDESIDKLDAMEPKLPFVPPLDEQKKPDEEIPPILAAIDEAKAKEDGAEGNDQSDANAGAEDGATEGAENTSEEDEQEKSRPVSMKKRKGGRL